MVIDSQTMASAGDEAFARELYAHHLSVNYCVCAEKN